MVAIFHALMLNWQFHDLGLLKGLLNFNSSLFFSLLSAGPHRTICIHNTWCEAASSLVPLVASVNGYVVCVSAY